MMEDSKKLQELIELAWVNNWQPESFYKKHNWVDRLAEVALGNTIGGQDDWISGFDAENSIIFDHDFIKALCRAKFGQTDGESMGFFDDKNGYGCKAGTWQVQIINLAVSTSRIKYLYETFIGNKS